MLTGRVPFKGEDLFDQLRQVCEVAPQPPSAVRNGLDPRLDALCGKALEKKPADRYGSAKEFASALADHLKNRSRTEPTKESALARDKSTTTEKTSAIEERERHDKKATEVRHPQAKQVRHAGEELQRQPEAHERERQARELAREMLSNSTDEQTRGAETLSETVDQTAREAEAAFESGESYSYGRGVKRDLAEARVWYQKAASLGHNGAIAALARLDAAVRSQLERTPGKTPEPTLSRKLAWYYVVNGAQHGPVSGSELQEVAASGGLTPSDLVWQEGTADWVSAGSVPGLFTTHSTTRSAKVTDTGEAQPVSRSRKASSRSSYRAARRPRARRLLLRWTGIILSPLTYFAAVFFAGQLGLLAGGWSGVLLGGAAVGVAVLVWACIFFLCSDTFSSEEPWLWPLAAGAGIYGVIGAGVAALLWAFLEPNVAVRVVGFVPLLVAGVVCLCDPSDRWIGIAFLGSVLPACSVCLFIGFGAVLWPSVVGGITLTIGLWIAGELRPY